MRGPRGGAAADSTPLTARSKAHSTEITAAHVPFELMVEPHAPSADRHSSRSQRDIRQPIARCRFAASERRNDGRRAAG
jgi:hypothetical protein